MSVIIPITVINLSLSKSQRVSVQGTSSKYYIPYGRHKKLALNALSAFVEIIQVLVTQ